MNTNPQTVLVIGALTGIGRAILFLASDKAAFITGHILDADGGKSAS